MIRMNINYAFIMTTASSSSTEVIIQRTIEGIQRMISPCNIQGEGEDEAGAMGGQRRTTTGGRRRTTSNNNST